MAEIHPKKTQELGHIPAAIIYTIPSHVSFMPKFLFKTLHNHQRKHSVSISESKSKSKWNCIIIHGNKTHKDRHNVKVKRFKTNNNDKQGDDHEKCKNEERNEVPAISSKDCRFGAGNGIRVGLKMKKMMKIKSKKKEKVENGYELCKKRILMGKKCKPLLGSPLLYDNNGVLIPQHFPDSLIHTYS